MAETEAYDLEAKLYQLAQDETRFAEEAIALQEKALGKAISDAEREELRATSLDPSRLIFLVPKVRTFQAFNYLQGLAVKLHGMSWSFVKPKAGYFITADNPIAFVRQKNDTSAQRAIDRRTVIVSFPLTPGLMLAFTNEPRISTEIVIERPSVEAQNLYRARMAEQYLYAHIDDKRIERLANKFKDSKATDKRSSRGPERYGEVRVPRNIYRA
jgi:hypothetical protein